MVRWRQPIDSAETFELEHQAALLRKSSDTTQTCPRYEAESAQPPSWLRSCVWCSNALLSYIRPCVKSRGAKKRRSGYRRALRFTALLVGGFVLVSLLEGVLFPSYQRPPQHYHELRRAILASTRSGRGNQENEKIFIAANIINEELIRGPWGTSLLELIDILGEQNVFVSIYENDSGIGTHNALRELQKKLPCNSSVVAGDHLSISELPKVTTPSGEHRVKRIAYLAEVRNRALRPLNGSYVPDSGQVGFRHASTKFDRVLFLNDIFFSAEEAAQLIFSTNHGQYRAACAVDFVSKVMFYDTFVVRDKEGYGMGLMFYPWFSSSGSAQSRRAVLAGEDAVPVRSCWGGLAAFDAAMFQTADAQRGGHALALQFSYTAEAFWEAAECCLIFAAMEQAHGSALAAGGSGVYVNPFVRVSYTAGTWQWLGFFRRFERAFRNLQYLVSRIGYPEYNPRRRDEPGQLVQHRVWTTGAAGGGGIVRAGRGGRSSGSFHTVERRAGLGGFCGQRRMFLMKPDVEAANRRGEKNWEKVSVPER
ncbi:hypothetical protein LOZ66_005436 [Ophidiomyces ophidiicola]|nr:hypothetical protein LOZ66_005436 [Ophidiomyces ophidiicola]